MGWINRLNVKAKLIAAFVFIILLTCVISTVSLMNLINSKKVASFVDDALSIDYAAVNKAGNDLGRVRAQIFSYNAAMINFSPESAKDTQNMLDQLGTDIKSIDMSKASDQEKNLMQSVLESYEKFYKAYTEDMYPFLDKGYSVDSRKAFTEKVYPAIDEVEVMLTAYTNLQLDEVNANVKTISSNTPIVVVSIVTLAVIAIAILIAILLSRSFLSVLYTAVKYSSLLAKGDLSKSISTSRLDEFGKLLQALETVRTELRETLGTIKNTTNAIHENINIISTATKEIDETSRNTQSRAVTVAAAANEMVSTTGDIANNCENAANTAENSNNITQEGVGKVQDAIEAIHSQVDKTKEDAKVVQALVNQGQKVGSIVETIADIANQTNLLALNAAIEAARAGEAGKGFAVVADEVRALASRTSTSTQEITKMVSQMQHDASTANNAMETSVKNMDVLVNVSSAIENTLHDISGKVSDVNNQITQIATAAEQQTSATTEISANMQDITKASDALSDQVGKLNDQVDDSVNMLNNLVTMINKFKL